MARSRRRQRDYKAEYRARIAAGRATGKTRQEARGHVIREHVVRAERVRVRYGVTPSQLTRLRAAARAHVLAELRREGTIRAPNMATIEKGMRQLSGDQLEQLTMMDGGTMRMLAGAALDVVADFFGEDFERNPLWYH